MNNGYSQGNIEFDTINWKTNPDEIIDFNGRMCLSGNAELKNTLFKDGVIELDIWTDGTRSYPGIIFRDQENGNFEIVYLRPHRAGLYDDAAQYAPSFNNSIGWQLYHGKGFTSKALIQKEQWVHLKIEVHNSKAYFFLDEAEDPLLDIDLVHNTTAGKIMLRTWNDKTYFSNFKLSHSDTSLESNIDTILENNIYWEISKLQDADKYNSDNRPRLFQDFNLDWEKVEPEKNGLININKYRTAIEGKANCIYARRLIYSEKNEKTKIAFGYSDAIKVFFNEDLIYSGNYAYRSRANSFTGTIGLFDTLYINLEKGINELFVVSKENSGGWGFNFNVDEKHSHPVVDSSDLIKQKWSTQLSDLVPESAVYDSVNKVIYYTNFNSQPKNSTQSTGYITKMDITGEVIEEMWADDLNRPTGICLYNNKLYVVERSSIAEISTTSGELIKRYNYTDKVSFLNDIINDEEGNFYISNTTRNHEEADIFILKNEEISPWIISDEFSMLNGIYYYEGSLLVGNSGKNKLQKIDITTKSISTIACLGSGIIDGIKIDKRGDFLVSLWRGELFKITKSGEITRLLYSIGKYNIADFEYIENIDLLVIPTFLGKNVRAYQFN